MYNIMQDKDTCKVVNADKFSEEFAIFCISFVVISI